MNPNQIQQGDVTLERVNVLPGDSKPLKREGGRVVLAYGSQSGNSHYLDADRVTLFETPGGTRYLVNESGADVELKHTRDHDPVLVAPGIHIVGGIHEIDHLTGLVSKVED